MWPILISFNHTIIRINNYNTQEEMIGPAKLVTSTVNGYV